MKGYGWDEYDTRRGGVQSIRDKENKVDITTSFIKVPGGANGGGWAARIKGKLREDAAPDQKTLIFLYITQEGGFESQLEAVRSGDASGYDDDVTIAGWSEPLGTYKLVVTRGEGKFPESDHSLSDERPTGKTVVQSLTYPDEVLWQAKPIVFKQLKEGVDYLVEHNFDNTNPPPPWQVYQLENRPGPGNAQIVEKVFEGDFEFDILFSSASDGKDVTSEDLTREIQATAESFAARFSRVFEFTGAFAAEKYQKFGRNMFSNLIGGIGYFYGHGVVDRSYASEYDEENEGFWEETAEARARRKEKPEGPYELFSSIPSRPFFPRGFLWDEGFHLLPIADWDIDLTLEIMKSWFSLMDDDGWIAREQILGQEARSKVPEEFQTQYPHYANPPTLFFVLDAFIDKLRKSNGTRPAGKEQLAQDETLLPTASIDNPEVGHEYLRQLYPLLRRQYDWFRKTQYGDIKTYDREAYSSREAYRWRGRTVQHCLTSGLDDYPRPQPPHPGELHVDLMSWMGMMTKSLIGVADVVGSMPEERAELAKILDAIEHNLDDLHWSHEEGCYCDATIDDYEEHKLVCHRGYVSLMPFLTGLIGPDSPKLGKILALLGDEDELFSPHGIRSLSKKDELYGTEENYWRSPVWINMNYLAIVQLYVSYTPPTTSFRHALHRHSHLSPIIEHRHSRRAAQEDGRQLIHPPAHQRRRHRLRQLGRDRLCVGAV